MSDIPYSQKWHVFFISGMIEAWGRGFDKIKTACEALYHTPIPEYEMSGDGIMVHCHANEKYLQLAMENRLGVDETILNRFRDAERMDVIRIMVLSDTSNTFTSAEVQATLGKPKPTVARLLKKICDAWLLKMVGSGRATKYQKSSQNHETI